MNDTIDETGEATTPLSLGKNYGLGETYGETPHETFDVAETAGPRIRWAGIIWGLIVSAIAVVVISITGSPFGRTAFLDWAAGLTAATGWLLVVLVAGALLLIFGLLALLRRRP